MILFRHWCWSFLGVVIESLPFIVIGAIISTIIQFYISEDIIKRIVPRRRGLAFLVAAFIGLVFPMCECAIVPVARSLIKKGVPIGITITFMLSVPIVNPFVITSTYYAFEANLTIVLIRVVGGILCSIIVGMLITYIFKHSKKIIIRKYTGMKDRKGRIKYLLDMDKAKTNLIKSFLKESNHTLDLSMNDGITVELEYMEIISKAGGTQFVNFYGDMAVLKYFLQPWVLKIINEDEQLKKKFLS